MKPFIYSLVLPLFFYPIYFIGVNAVDSIVGDQQLINWLYFDSKSELLKTFFSDWLSSLPLMYLFFFILIIPADLISKKISGSTGLFSIIAVAAAILLISYLVGFREVALISNVFSALLIMVFYYSFTIIIGKLLNEN